MVADRGSKIRQKLYKQVFSPCLYKKCVVALVIVFFISAVETATACTESQFLVEHADGKPSCEDCAPCPPGQGLSHECGTHISANAMVTCVACQSGASFSSSYNTSDPAVFLVLPARRIKWCFRTAHLQWMSNVQKSVIARTGTMMK